MRNFNLEGLFTYLSELFAGHPSSGFSAGSTIPNKKSNLPTKGDPFDAEFLQMQSNELDEGGFLAQELVTRRGGQDRHFLA